MLEYDNSAFSYFAITCLLFYVIPSSYYTLYEIAAAFFYKPKDNDKVIRTALEKQKEEALRKKNSGWNRLLRWGFVINFIFLVIALYYLITLVNFVMVHGQVSQFDPFQVLEIDSNADTSEIKKAYRKLSLKYHPDKNPGNKYAEEMFLKIAKAYEALTDPVAMENLKLYGNPDGKQAFELSIGLPTFLLENPKVVLVLYLIGMVVVIPIAVYLWYSNSKEYGEKNIKHQTYDMFYNMINEGTRVKMLPEVLATAAEYTALFQNHNNDPEAFKNLNNKLNGKSKLIQKPKIENPIVLQSNLLIHAHVMRLHEELTADFRDQLTKMLTIAPELLDGLIEISKSKKSLQTLISAIKFSQHVIQGLWVNDSPFLQLPYFTEKEAHHVVSGRKVAAKTLKDYVRLPDDDKKGLDSFKDEPEKVKEILTACKSFPQIQLTYSLFVEDEDEVISVDGDEPETLDESLEKSTEYQEFKKLLEVEKDISGKNIYQNDYMTLRVKIVRENLIEGDTAPPVLAPFVPRQLKERWYAVVTFRPIQRRKGKSDIVHEPIMLAIEKISDQGKHVQADLHFPAPPEPGDYTIELNLFSDCYVGFDEENVKINFKVLSSEELPKFVPHPADVKLDKDQTLFESFKPSNVLEGDSDDEQEEGDAKGLYEVDESKNTKSGESGNNSEAQDSESDNDN